jgi:hypothetical protein
MPALGPSSAHGVLEANSDDDDDDGKQKKLGPCKKQKLTPDAAPLLVWLGWAGGADIV